MTASTESMMVEYFALRVKSFFQKLSDDDLDILKTIPPEHLNQQILSLITARAGQRELDIFCGYYTDDRGTFAVFISDCPSQCVGLLSQGVVKTRIKNSQDQNYPFDQSQQALIGWPI